MPTHLPTFDWQLPGKVVAIDNNGELLLQKGFDDLIKTGAMAVIAFDPASRVEDPQHFEAYPDVQLFRHAVLGNGQPAELYACLAPEMTSTLPPLPPEQLPLQERAKGTVLARLPINTIALDSITGLESLDWLILADNSDSLAILEHGTKTLANTLLIQARVSFQPTHYQQPDFMQLSHWASRHGFRFYSLNQLSHYSHLPEQVSLVSDQATELASANALFIPSRERMANLTSGELNKLSFLLHSVYGMADIAYEVLYQLDPAKAQMYLEAEGLTLQVDGAITERNLTTSSFSAAQIQWWESSSAMMETVDYPLEADEADEAEVFTQINDQQHLLSGDLVSDVSAIKKSYPLASSPLREPSYVFELLDNLETSERFDEGYSLLQQASQEGLDIIEQLEILIYWRKTQLRNQQGVWSPSRIALTSKEPAHWHEKGRMAAEAGEDIEEAVWLRHEEAFTAAEHWLLGYREKLPDSPLVLAEQAMLNSHLGKSVAIDTLIVSLREHSADPKIAIHLAFWLLNTKKANKALATLNRLESNDPEIILVKVKALIQQKKFDLALQQLEKIYKKTNIVASEVYLAKADIYQQQKDFSKACKMAMCSIFYRPACFSAWEKLCELTIPKKEYHAQNINMLEMLSHHDYKSECRFISLLVSLYKLYKNWSSAAQWARQGLAQDAKNIELRMNLLQSLHHLEEWPALRLVAREGVDFYNRNLTFYYYLGVAENGIHNSKKALKHLYPCYQASPKDSRVCFEYAVALNRLGHHKDALDILNNIGEKKLRKPHLSLMGNIFSKLGLYDSAENIFRDLLKKYPKETALHWNFSNILLKKGKVGEGLDEYEWGFEVGERVPNREFDVPRWNGESLDNGKVIVWHEQGLGDEIIFAACLKELDKPGCNIIFQCRERLFTLFQRTFENIEIQPIKGGIKYSEVRRKLNVQAHIPIGSLVRLLYRDTSTFPDFSGYLQCDSSKMLKWRNYLETQFGKDKLFVGISWAGGATDLKKARTYFGTKKENFMPILQVKGVVFISLMYFDVENDLLELREKGVPIYKMRNVDMKNDLEEVSAITKSLDLVIAGENFPFIHAGSLGVECWVISNFSAHVYMDDPDEFKFFRSIKITRIEKPYSQSHILGTVKKLAQKLEYLARRNQS